MIRAGLRQRLRDREASFHRLARGQLVGQRRDLQGGALVRGDRRHELADDRVATGMVDDGDRIRVGA